MHETVIARLTREIAGIDVVMGLFRDILPTHGFKLVVPPPGAGCAPHAFAATWRRGEAQAVSHQGVTPARALLRATECELLKLHELSAIAKCDMCRGLGWFVTNAGSLQVCRHAERKEFGVE
jgi:hypothetical protein